MELNLRKDLDITTPGISAHQLQRQLGLGSYRTAWYMLGRLRKGMVNDKRSRLQGVVEADETIIGGPSKNKRGRGTVDDSHKSLVAGAVEVIIDTCISNVLFKA